jgi:hypothetical protein
LLAYLYFILDVRFYYTDLSPPILANVNGWYLLQMTADPLETQFIVSIVGGDACAYQVWIGDTSTISIGFVQNLLVDAGTSAAIPGYY